MGDSTHLFKESYAIKYVTLHCYCYKNVETKENYVLHGDTESFLCESITTDHVQGPCFTVSNLVMENKLVHTEAVQLPNWPRDGAGTITNERNRKDLINKAPRVPPVTAQQQADILPSPRHHARREMGEQCPCPGISSSLTCFGGTSLEWRQLWASLRAELP